MKQKILEIMGTKTIKDSVITLSGTAVNGFLGVLFFLILARSLGPEDFGVLSFSIVAITLISDIADLGINTGIINFVSKHYLSDKQKVSQILKLSLECKLIVWFGVLIFGWLTIPFLTGQILQKPQLEPFLRLSLLGVGGAMLFSFVTNSLQAFTQFKIWSFLNIFMNALRLILLTVLVYGLVLTPSNALILYISITFLGFLIGFTFLPKRFLLIKNETLMFPELFHFNKWIALTIFLSAISSRIDSLFLTKLTNFTEVGVYSVANQLTSYIPQLSSAVAVVVAPKFSTMSNNRDAKKYFWKLQILCLGLAGISLIIIPAVWFLIPFFYGVPYYKSSLLFLILFLGNLLFFISTPAHQAIYYYFSKSKVVFYMTLIIFVINILSMWFFITLYGSTGAAFAVFLVSLFNLLISTIWVINKFKKA